MNCKIFQSNFVQQVTSTLFTKVIGLGISVVTAVIVARWLGPDGKGVLALVLLLPQMFGLFLNAGINVANVYYAGLQKFSIGTLTKNSVTFTLLSSSIGLGIIGLLIITNLLESFIPGVPIWLLVVASFTIPFLLIHGYLRGILQGIQHIHSVNLVKLFQSVITLVLTAIFVIIFDLEILGALLAFLGSILVSLFILVFLLHRLGGIFKPQWNYKVMKTTLFFGLKGYVGNILQFFNYRLDIFIINYFLDPSSVGVYTVSVRLAELLWHLPNSVSFVIFPKAAATSKEKMNNFTPRIFGITLVLTTLGAIILTIIGKPLIRLIYSSAFITAYTPLLLLLPGVILLGGGKVLTNEIAGRGYPHYNSINAGLALVLTTILDLILIPKYGIEGAAIASSVAYTTIFITSVGFYLYVSKEKFS